MTKSKRNVTSRLWLRCDPTMKNLLNQNKQTSIPEQGCGEHAHSWEGHLHLSALCQTVLWSKCWPLFPYLHLWEINDKDKINKLLSATVRQQNDRSVTSCACVRARVCLTWPHSDISWVFINDFDLLGKAVLLHDALCCLSHGFENLEKANQGQPSSNKTNVDAPFKNKRSGLTIIHWVL